MSVPHRCPVCNGTGLVSVPPGIAGDVTHFTTSSTGPWPCRCCNGTGILWQIVFIHQGESASGPAGADGEGKDA